MTKRRRRRGKYSTLLRRLSVLYVSAAANNREPAKGASTGAEEFGPPRPLLLLRR